MNFENILNWKLLSGSHEFPGSDGGTCINEAAIVAAGFEYKKVNCCKDCPPCFSQVIASYAICLNDKMPDNIRNELLMPFVIKLSGTADTKEIETARVNYIIIQTARQILAPLFKSLNFNSIAEDLSNCNTILEVFKSTRDAARAARAEAGRAANYAADAAENAADAASYAAQAASYAACSAAAASSATNAANKQIWLKAVKILDEAIKLGNHPEEPDIQLVKMRLDKIRVSA